ncbi:MAG: nuclear transport factor 2 family protein [Deltaproteobacteria bacterium]|jgi:3-phenylpropionate/cinnamic acid dioxygenase small subunit|nr:nuclear transport factor 2 family protein [Deltaproteobacteria bacterium]MBW2497177.1 nuclear transport factor 2 family protein [Deltaproteobacteria bacterium]
MEDAMRELIDERDIRATLVAYTKMVDQRDWDRMDEIFAPGASLDYRSSGGQAGPYRETLGWLARALDPWPLNLHLIGNFEIEIDGDRAKSSCYFLAPMGRNEPDGRQIMTTNAGSYHDELVRTPEGWRIHARVCEQTILTGLPEDYVIPG